MMTFIERVEQNCRLHPERDAVREGNRRLNYGELWIYSASVYAYLHRRHIGPGDVVMLHLGNTTDTIIACIGVLRAGAAFVIAGRDQAPQAVHYMGDDCGCKAWIDDENLRQILNGKGKNGLVAVDEHALAYVIYTSGSTRKPKGVMIERGALTLCAPSIAWKGKPILRTDDRLALLSPLTFAAGMIMMTVVLTSGVTLVAVPGDTLPSPAALKRYFLDHRITACFMTPTLYHTFHDFNPEMRGVVLGGEPVSDIEPTDYDLYNMYGQSESGFVVAMQKINGTGAEATIGTPQAEGIRTQVLDEAGRPVQNGEVGELCYESPWFRGYVGLEAETQRVLRGGLVHSGDLCRRLSDGALSMMGRVDNLLKINGLWFNPFEIESAIARCFDVDWVFVRILTESTKVFICVYYTGKATLSMADAREKLRGQLPDYLLPTHFYRLSRLPANRNGKVDLRELPSPTEASPTPVLISPDRLEQEIGDIVNKVMDRPMSIGRDANLISLGLSSLTSIVIIGEIEEKTGIQLSLAGIMAHPDIAHICEAVKAALEQGCIRAEKQDTVEEHMDYLPLTKNQLAVFADSETSKGSTQYNLPAYFSFSRAEMDASRLEDAIRQVFYRHAVFRTRIVRRRDIPIYYRIEGCEVYQALSDEPLAIGHAHSHGSPGGCAH